MGVKRWWVGSLAVGVAAVAVVLVLAWRSAQETGGSLETSFAEAPSGATEILWDTRGIPHVYSDEPADLFYAFGWAQMHSHADALLRLYGEARGRAAEYWGEQHLEMDRAVAQLGIAERVQEWYHAQGEEYRTYLDAFAEGMNAYARSHLDRIDAEVRRVLPVLPTDALARFQVLVHIEFLATPALRDDLLEDWSPGSNAWALAPARSESGRAMLLINPHLPWSDLTRLYEAHLVAPGVDVTGVTMIGLPFLVMGFNDDLGWAHTVNTLDGADLYELRLSGTGYTWNGTERPFERATRRLEIRHWPGWMSTEEIEVLRSVHGPVLLSEDDRALALRLVGLDQPHVFEQYWDMARSRSLDEFEAGVKRLQMPMFTIVYADRDGNILHLFGGRVPVRAEGDWELWQGIVPGDTPATLWSSTHPYEDLPQVLNPRSGWLQNSNDPPWTTTFPAELDPNAFPPYMAPRSMDLRAQRSAGMLSEGERFSFEELVEGAHSSRSELADRILDELLEAARGVGDGLESEVRTLSAWDRETDSDSRGALLFYAWTRAMRERGGSRLFSTPWDETTPLGTPDGLLDPGAALEALRDATGIVESFGVEPGAPWGEVFRLRAGELDLPASGGPASLGIFRVLSFRGAEDGRFTASSGETYVAAVEFSDPLRAQTRLIYGNASQPGSPHRSDQLTAAAEGRLFPVWRTRQEILDNLSERTAF